MTDAPWPAGAIDPRRAHPSRVYDYLLGGSHNTAADRALAARLIAAVPDIAAMVQANRAFLRRAVWYCLDTGIQQFIDLGCGVPAAGAVHEIAQRRVPDARILYVDVDPLAVALTRSLIRGNDRVAAIQGDLRHPNEILDNPFRHALLDLRQPVALLMLCVLPFVADEDDPWAVVAGFRDRVAAGSYLVISHFTGCCPHAIRPRSTTSAGSRASAAPGDADPTSSDSSPGSTSSTPAWCGYPSGAPTGPPASTRTGPASSRRPAASPSPTPPAVQPTPAANPPGCGRKPSPPPATPRPPTGQPTTPRPPPDRAVSTTDHTDQKRAAGTPTDTRCGSGRRSRSRTGPGGAAPTRRRPGRRGGGVRRGGLGRRPAAAVLPPGRPARPRTGGTRRLGRPGVHALYRRAFLHHRRPRTGRHRVPFPAAPHRRIPAAPRRRAGPPRPPPAPGHPAGGPGPPPPPRAASPPRTSP